MKKTLLTLLVSGCLTACAVTPPPPPQPVRYFPSNASQFKAKSSRCTHQILAYQQWMPKASPVDTLLLCQKLVASGAYQ